jgi:magnesium chelatase subunit D
VTPAFPLSAIVGQEDLLDALLVNAVAPEVGGVLVRGERGTAKSTAVRALAPLLPAVSAAEGQPFAFAPGELGPGGPIPADAPVRERPAPLVELPLGATLDRLLGSLDLGRAIDGERAFEPGLLARAHRGILYVDEVNLLPDHLVDALLDAAASGVARVEREAVSVSHEARFQLVGTMNAEEGELRPQLLDRFGLGVEARAPEDPGLRAEIVRRRLAYEADPAAFAAAWREREQDLAARLAAARKRLSGVRLPERELLRITSACARLGLDGVRGDVVAARAARALAALAGEEEAGPEQVLRAAKLALSHRRRHDPLDAAPPDPGEIARAFDEPPDDEPPEDHPPRGGRSRSAPANGSGSRETCREPSTGAGTGAAPEPTGPEADPSRAAGERRDPPAAATLPAAALALRGPGAGPAGRRAQSASRQAGSIDSRPASPGAEDLAIVATLRERLLGGSPSGLREHLRAGREGALLCLVLDASGSMGARRRLARVKGALLMLLREAHARRDRVALIAFRESEAQLLVAPAAPLARAAEAIRHLRTGGPTPLAAGLDLAGDLVRREKTRERGRRAVAIVLTDGRIADPGGVALAAAGRLGRAADAVHVVDTEAGPARVGLAAALAAAAGGRVHELETPAVKGRMKRRAA